MTLAELIPSVLNPLFDGRVYQNKTPQLLSRGTDGATLPFVVWLRMGGIDGTYIDQTAPNKRHARVQLTTYAVGDIVCEQLHEQVMLALLGSIYTVGVYGSPVGTYDADRNLTGERQQFSIWFQPTQS